jgi:sarcosine oxidase
MTTEFDVAVIGLGAMGAHAAAALAERGLAVIGIERFGPLHDRGSSHGDTRIIRLAYFEDPCYVPLLRRAYANWRRLEAQSGEDLLTMTGAMEFGRVDGEVVKGVLASAREHDLDIDVMTAADAMRRFPAWRFEPDEAVILEPEGGFLRPERCIMAALKLAGAHGATLHFNERVLGIGPKGQGIEIVSADGRYRARKVVIAAGSYVAGLVPALRGTARPIKQVVGWYAVRDQAAAAVGAMPVFIGEDRDQGTFFGFPALGPAGIKLGKHGHFGEEIDPEAANPPVNAADRAIMADFVRRHLPAADPDRLTDAITCRYTMLPQDFFLIDALPADPRIIVASPCSGHGFKFASVIGEILADLAERGTTDLPIAPFSFAALEGRLGRPLPETPLSAVSDSGTASSARAGGW